MQLGRMSCGRFNVLRHPAQNISLDCQPSLDVRVPHQTNRPAQPYPPLISGTLAFCLRGLRCSLFLSPLAPYAITIRDITAGKITSDK